MIGSLPKLSALGFHARAWWRRRSFKPYVKRRRVEQLDFDFYVGDAESQIWNDVEATDQDWPELRFILGELLRPGDVIFDCGAHHGCTAVLFAMAAGPDGRVVAFEPHPRNVEIIRRNLALNRIDSVRIEACAAAAAPGSVQLRDRSNGAIAFAWWTRGFEVRTIALDDYVEDAGMAPTFLKIDVEGYEVEVLRGASRVLATAPKLAIELHPRALPRYGSSVRELLDLLPLERYDAWVLEEGQAVRPLRHPERLEGHRAHLFARPRRADGSPAGVIR